jgi:phospholipid/cholesterol/gamma-HCH transport system permease protein
MFTFKAPIRQVLEQIVSIGFNTLPMVILMTGFSGMVLSLETASWLEQYGARDTIGALICFTSVIEIAPIFVGFAIAAQAGTAITAELAHMQITEQISAMRLSKVNPINYLVSTRLIAMIYSLPLAIIIGAFCSIAGGLIIASLYAHIEYSVYLDSVWRALKIKDIWFSLIKGFVLANYLIAIHTSFGLGTRGGAKELGTMTSLSTIWVAVGIICIDAFLDYLMYID